MRLKLIILLLALSLGAATAHAVDWRPGQVSVGTSGASLIGSTAGRTGLCWWNANATNPVFCGKTSAVTSSTGSPFLPGMGICVASPEAALPVYCISTGGPALTGFKENVQ